LIHQGKSVKAWIRQLEGAQTGKAAEATEAKQVLIELGLRGVPWMVAELQRTRPTAWVNRRPNVTLWKVYPRTRRWIRRPRNVEDMAVRKELYEVLGAFGSNAAPAIPTLRVGLKDTWNGHYLYAIQALGQIGPEAEDAVPDLLPFLESNRPHIQQAAALALHRIGFSNLKTSRLLNDARVATNLPGQSVRKPWP
jgi:HEAT repeat protein